MRSLWTLSLLVIACTSPAPEPKCGNGVIEVGEACDDGNAVETDACSTACVAARCGDGLVQDGELCEGTPEEGCYQCEPRCGDGIVAGDEGCDDGNYEPNDACDDCDPVRCGALVFQDTAQAPALVTDVVGDFTLPLNGGRSWQFSQAFNGCDSYHFILRDGAVAYTNGLINSDLRSFLVELPANAHVFFGSYAASDQQALDSVRNTQGLVDRALGRLSPAQRSAWEGRIHYIMEPVQGLVGPIGDVARREPRSFLNFTFSIDRFQRLREHGLLRDPTLQNSDVDIRWVAEEAKGFNFEFERHERLRAEPDITEVLLTEGLVHGGGGTTFEVELPSTEALRGYDTLAIDMLMDCPDHTHENCNPWDYSAPLFLCGLTPREGCGDGELDEAGGEACDDGNTLPGDGCSEYCELESGRLSYCPDRVEFAYWITTYKRPGRWVHDITPMLAHFKQGGKRRMRFQVGTNGKQYLLTIKLRLSRTTPELGRPDAVVPMWTGGGYGAGYNEAQELKEVTIPDDVKRVEFVAHITGHGMSGAMNCAEFCAHNHRIQVGDGPVHEKDHSVADVRRGCEQAVDEGVVPNQFGTWPFGRAGWCPGQEVRPWRVDLTDELRPGSTQTLRYESDVRGQPGTGGRIRMVSWLVYWR